jgi:hypothetical protein
MTSKRDELLDRFRQQLTAPPPAPLEAARAYLLTYCLDAESFEEVERSVAKMMTIDSVTLREGLAGIEGLLLDPPEAGTLRSLVVQETSWVLEDDTDEGAKAWLKKVALMLRRHLGAGVREPANGLYTRQELAEGRS